MTARSAVDGVQVTARSCRRASARVAAQKASRSGGAASAGEVAPEVG